MDSVKAKTIRGGFARLGAQGVNFALRLISLAVLARLLGPKEYGLIGMVTAFTGILNLLRDFGLSSATVQRTTVTNEQMSALFWINLLTGGALGVLLIGCAPAIAAFYHEPRLVGVSAVLALGFLFNGAGVQHLALMQRQMRFSTLSAIGVVSTVLGTAVAISGATIGLSYWALAAMTITLPLTATIGFWLATGWTPSLPRRNSGIRPLLRFGGTVTVNSVVTYFALNFEKVLLGRFWGADAIGLYGRAYQLINIPTDNLNSSAGEVAFAILSRLQNDAPRLRRYFLGGYTLIVSLTLPITFTCALFADDVIRVLLGPKWDAAATIFRLLTPTILVFAVANPLGWLLSATGQVGRLLKMALVIGPVMIASYSAGIHYGPEGVATAYSIVMTMWLLPLVAWALHGSGISPRDLARSAGPSIAASIGAGSLAYILRSAYGSNAAPAVRLTLEGSLLFISYFCLLFCMPRQRGFYLDLGRAFIGRREIQKAPERAFQEA
ncbi:MAG TPA: lipopolysaccharide biosynthesis protein [Bryobacteraceae bacterium]|jgi:PST family polysaccharide transporter